MQQTHGLKNFHIVPQTFVLPYEYQEFCSKTPVWSGRPWQLCEMLSERLLLLPLRLFCQRQGPVDHQTSSIFQRSGHLLGQQREWFLCPIQRFSIFNVHIIAITSPDVAPVLKNKAGCRNCPSHTISQRARSPPRLAPSCDQFASHLDHISSCLTRWHRFACLHRHASDFPAACPGLSLSIPVHGKPSTSLLIRTILHRCTWIGSRNSGNKVSLTKMGQSEEEQHLCPRLCDLKILAF